MLPTKVNYMKNAVNQLHNKIGLIEQHCSTLNRPSLASVDSLIEWIETELYQQDTRILEADEGFIIGEIMRGITTIEFNCNEVTLYYYLKHIIHRSNSIEPASITKKIIKRLNDFLEHPVNRT